MSHTRPNILHLFTDMQRADTIHALGNATIKTPHLDRPVSEGTAFTMRGFQTREIQEEGGGKPADLFGRGR